MGGGSMGRDKAKRVKILNAVEKSLKNKRFHEFTLDEVARVARVGKGTIYRYFADKEDLVFQLAMHGHDELCQIVAASISEKEAPPFEELLLDICSKISEFMLGRMALLRAIDEQRQLFPKMSGKYKAEFMEKRADLLGAISKVLEKGRSEGLMRTDLPVETQSIFLVELMRGRDHGFGDELPPMSMVVDVFLNGMGPNRKA